MREHRSGLGWRGRYEVLSVGGVMEVRDVVEIGQGGNPEGGGAMTGLKRRRRGGQESQIDPTLKQHAQSV